MRLSQQFIEDGKWMIEEAGELVVYHPTGDRMLTYGEDIEIYAIIDRVGANEPEYGYEQTLSGRHHYLTLHIKAEGTEGNHLEFIPRRDEVVTFDGSDHQIDYVSPVTDTVQIAVKY